MDTIYTVRCNNVCNYAILVKIMNTEMEKTIWEEIDNIHLNEVVTWSWNVHARGAILK